MNINTIGELLAQGSGKTTRLLKALPMNSYFLVHGPELQSILRVYLREIGRKDIKPICCDGYVKEIRGQQIESMGIDHLVEDLRMLKDADVYLLQKIYRVKNVYTLDEIGIPTRVSGEEYIRWSNV